MTKPNLVQLKRLLGNPDVYAQQRPDGSWFPVREPLDDDVLRAHMRQEKTVGTYTSLGDTARTLVFDFDTGPEQAKLEATKVSEALETLGVLVRYTGLEFSGNKGYHLWVVLQQYRPSAELRRVGRAALAMSGVTSELNPKQDGVPRDLGNLVKLPGGKHQKTGLANDFVGYAPEAMPTPMWEKVVAVLPPEQRARRQHSENRFPCLEHIQAGVGEGGRNNQLFHLATMFRRSGMTEETLEVVLSYVNAKCDPPLDDRELENVLESSRTSGPICSSLPQSVRDACGGHCITERLQGLTARPGQLRHAQEGEAVVLTVGEHVGNTITLEHDDIEVGKAQLRTKEN